jgi:hypothetical protein
MADNTSAGATPVVAGATPTQTAQPNSTSASTGTDGTQPATGAATGTDDGALGDAGHKALESERQARRDAERKAKATQDELDKLKAASLSDEEKRQKRLADLEREQADWQRERQEFLLERAVQGSAAKLGFVDPTDAVALLDRSSLEYETDGTPRNLDQQLTALAKAKPHLLAPARVAGSFDTGTAGGRQAAKRIYTLADLRDPTFFQANQKDILLARQEGRIQG